MPSILSEELFQRGQAQLTRIIQTQAGIPPDRFYLLRRLLRFGECERRYSGNPSKRGRREYRCSGCGRLSIGEWCTAKSYNAVARVLCLGLGGRRGEAGRPLTERFEAHGVKLGARDVQVRSELEHLMRQIAKTARRKAKLLSLERDDELTEMKALKTHLVGIQRIKVGLKERIVRAKKRIARHEAEEAAFA